MSSAAFFMSILAIEADDAESVGITAEDLARIRSNPCRIPTLDEVVVAVDALGINAHHPSELAGEGTFSVRNLDIADAIAAALRIALETGPLIVFDESEPFPIVVRASDDLQKLIAEVENRRDASDREVRQWVFINPLSTYQWAEQPGGEPKRETDLSWLETLGVEVPISDYRQNVAPHPDQVAEMLAIQGVWSDERTLWTADAHAVGLGTLELHLDSDTSEPFSLQFCVPGAREVAAFAGDLVRTHGPMVMGRWCGPYVLVVDGTNLDRVTELIGDL